MTVEIVAAIANRLVIGRDNRLPWQLASDLKRFQQLTNGHSVIMGRKTWEGLLGPLSDRQNIVVSNTMEQGELPAGVVLARSFDDALRKCDLPPPVFAIGGTEIYREAMRQAQRMHITKINCDFEGDVYFPEFSNVDWAEDSRVRFASTAASPFEYDFIEFVRV